MPVLYDPGDLGKVEIDVDGVKTEKQERLDDLQARAARLNGEMRDHGGTPPPGP